MGLVSVIHLFEGLWHCSGIAHSFNSKLGGEAHLLSLEKVFECGLFYFIPLRLQIYKTLIRKNNDML